MPQSHHALLLRVCSLCAGLLFGLVSQADQPAVYRWVDENGTVHYSDAPPPDTQAQPADLPDITIVPARTTSKQKTDDQNKQADKPEKQSITFADLRLVRPKPEENLWGTGGTVTAEVAFSGRLPRGYAIQFVLDGKPQKPTRKKNQTLTEVYRGGHRLYAQIIEIKTGKVVAKTPPVTFYVHQVNIFMRNN